MNLARALLVSLLLSTLALSLFACGKTAAADQKCAHDGECESGTCSLVGRCAPGECECSGAACGKTQATCEDGHVCVAGKPPLERGYNRCRATCTATRQCTDAKECVDGLCSTPSIDELSWANLPRAVGCTPGTECRYDLRVPSGVEIDGYRWSFGDEPAETSDTREPGTSHVFAVGGIYTVKVEAFAVAGGSFVLTRTETLCARRRGEHCDFLGATCCVGSCQQSVCK